MTTNLTRIGEKACREPALVFTSLYHHVTDVDNLRACYDALPEDRAVGVDGVTKEAYGKHLEDNLQDLSGRLKRRGYRPQPKRRSYIPKSGSEKGRPLGISCFEDKIVELAVKRVLEPIYEPVFVDSSYGYRLERNPHICLDALGRTIQQKRVSHVVEADIRRYFDRVNHGWMKSFLQHRIGDPRIIELIERMLKGGILEDGLVQATEAGTPQGSILSPLLSNVYLLLKCWMCGLVVESESSVEVKRTTSVSPTTFSLAFSIRTMQLPFFSSYPTVSRNSVWNWQWRRRNASSSDVLPAHRHASAARNRRSSRSWDSRTTAGRPRRGTSRSNAARAVRG